MHVFSFTNPQNMRMETKQKMRWHYAIFRNPIEHGNLHLSQLDTVGHLRKYLKFRKLQT